MSQIRGNNEFSIHPLIAGRWSPRAFDAEQAVETEKLSVCLEAARWSSSCFGDEPWRFIVADRSHNQDGWRQMLGVLAEKNQSWAKHAPVLILACSAQNFSQNGKPNRWGQYDTGQAMMSLALQAVSEGLITHSMGGFDVQAAAQAFDIAAEFTPMSVTAVGYQGDSSTLDEGFQTVEIAERKRKPLAQIALTDWHTPWQA
ncbi:MAG: nitroreductase family protein [Mariprofundaceae bacterium]